MKNGFGLPSRCLFSLPKHVTASIIYEAGKITEVTVF